MDSDKCICCGDAVPEGLMVCLYCQEIAEEKFREAEKRNLVLPVYKFTPCQKEGSHPKRIKIRFFNQKFGMRR